MPYFCRVWPRGGVRREAYAVAACAGSGMAVSAASRHAAVAALPWPGANEPHPRSFSTCPMVASRACEACTLTLVAGWEFKGAFTDKHFTPTATYHLPYVQLSPSDSRRISGT